MCTLRNFPNQIEHCIEWSREKFNTSFVTTPQDVAQYMSDPKKMLAELKTNENSTGRLKKLQAIRDFINMKQSLGYEGCVALAKQHFVDDYDYMIRDI